MAKYALCAPRHDIINLPYADWRLSMQDRAIVDDINNVNPDIKQLLPYMIFWRFNANLDVDGTNLINKVEVLAYRRDVQGDEVNLIGKLSIGFGGHVDCLPSEAEDLSSLLTREALREAMEELSVTLQQDKLFTIIQDQLTSQRGLMLESTKTDSVHFGIPIFYMINNDEQPAFDAAVPEAGHVKDIGWLTLTSLLGDETDHNPLGLENWSVSCAQLLANKILCN